MKHLGIVTSAVVGTLALFGAGMTANAASYTQHSNAITQYSSGSLRTVDNKATGFVKAGDYADGMAAVDVRLL